jgi:hypothetical protein
MADKAPDYISSDCPIAGRHIEQGMAGQQEPAGKQPAKEHPISLVRKAYGI